jgi:hypothetical protein
MPRAVLEKIGVRVVRLDRALVPSLPKVLVRVGVTWKM